MVATSPYISWSICLIPGAWSQVGWNRIRRHALSAVHCGQHRPLDTEHQPPFRHLPSFVRIQSEKRPISSPPICLRLWTGSVGLSRHPHDVILGHRSIIPPPCRPAKVQRSKGRRAERAKGRELSQASSVASGSVRIIVRPTFARRTVTISILPR